jgi:hypothetical protein
MAKQNQPQQTKHELPSVGDLPSTAGQSAAVVADVPQPRASSVEPLSVRSSTGMIEVPMLEFDPVNVFVARRVEMKLSLQQAMKLKRIKLALEMQNAQLESGKRINTPADVIRWILDNIS